MYIYITESLLLYRKNQHNIVSQLYFNKKRNFIILTFYINKFGL